MSDLRGLQGDTGISFSTSFLPDHWPTADEESYSRDGEWQSTERSSAKTGRSGTKGRQGFLNSANAGELRDGTQSYLVEQPATTEEIRLTGPVQFILKLLDFWNLERRDAVKLLGFVEEEAEYVYRLLEGKEQLHGRDVKERISNLFFIRSSLRSLFRDLNTENEWLREQHTLLDGKSPLSMLLEGSLLGILSVRDYVDTVTRR